MTNAHEELSLSTFKLGAKTIMLQMVLIFYVALSCATLLLHSFSSALVSYRYVGPAEAPNFASTEQYLTIAAGLLLFFWGFQLVRIRDQKQCALGTADKTVRLKVLRGFSLCVVNACICLLSAIQMWLFCNEAIVCIAYAEDAAGAYGSAEEIYRSRFVKQADSPLSVLKTHSVIEPDDTQLLRSGAVAAVYGKLSPQMAERNFYLGQTYLQNRKNKGLSETAKERGCKYLTDGLVILEHGDCYGRESLEALSQSALLLRKENPVLEKKLLLGAANHYPKWRNSASISTQFLLKDLAQDFSDCPDLSILKRPYFAQIKGGFKIARLLDVLLSGPIVVVVTACALALISASIPEKPNFNSALQSLRTLPPTAGGRLGLWSAFVFRKTGVQAVSPAANASWRKVIDSALYHTVAILFFATMYMTTLTEACFRR